MTAKQGALGDKVIEQIKRFYGVGLALNTFVVQNISLPNEFAEDTRPRIGMNMWGLGKFTQFEARNRLILRRLTRRRGRDGHGLGAGAQWRKRCRIRSGRRSAQRRAGRLRRAVAAAVAPVTSADTKFCIECGQPIPQRANFAQNVESHNELSSCGAPMRLKPDMSRSSATTAERLCSGAGRRWRVRAGRDMRPDCPLCSIALEHATVAKTRIRYCTSATAC